MVNASAVEDYELWFLWATLIFSAGVGFAVAYIQSLHTKHPDTTSLVVSIIFGILFLLSFVRVLTLRSRLVKESKTYPMRAVGLSQGAGRGTPESTANPSSEPPAPERAGG